MPVLASLLFVCYCACTRVLPICLFLCVHLCLSFCLILCLYLCVLTSILVSVQCTWVYSCFFLVQCTCVCDKIGENVCGGSKQSLFLMLSGSCGGGGRMRAVPLHYGGHEPLFWWNRRIKTKTHRWGLIMGIWTPYFDEIYGSNNNISTSKCDDKKMTSKYFESMVYCVILNFV